MLYGIDTRDRDKKDTWRIRTAISPGPEPPWRELLLEWQGRDVTIRRGPRGELSPLGAFPPSYTGTGGSLSPA